MMRIQWMALSAGAALAFGPSDAFADTQIVYGKCDEGSHIAEGGVKQDLSSRRARFFCDSAVITFMDPSGKRVLIQFSDRRSKIEDPLGFAALVSNDGQMADVYRVYLKPGKPMVPDAGKCRFFFRNKHMTAIMCGARIEDGDRAIAPIVVFTALPGQ